MCGIAGFYGAPSLSGDDLVALTRALAHRGPDGEGHRLDGATGTGLGHRRLAILDLSARATQPMPLEGSGLWIVFNGEIFNFLELRRELEGKGHRFRSDSDTEVVLAAWSEWGEAAFRRFNGMWALALYDERRRELILCRDRYGVKPLHWRRHGRGLVFASECKAFWAIGRKLGLRWDARGLRTALQSSFDLEASGHTLLEGVETLPPGHLLVASPEGIQVRRWWSTLDELPAVPTGLAAQAGRFRELLLDACRLRMRSDVPLGTSLSGGLDSSSVVAAVARVGGQGRLAERGAPAWRKAFVHSFPGTPLDETAEARRVADVAGVELIEVRASPEEVGRDLDGILYAFEGVYAGMPDSLWRLYRAQRASGVVVSLDGHGVDELLGGYDGYLLAALADAPLWSGQFAQLLRQRREMLGEMAPSSARTLAQVLIQRRPARRVVRALRVLRPAWRRLLNPFLSREAWTIEPYEAARTEVPAEWGVFQRTLYQDFHHGILPHILKNYDLMSMAHGVEVRMPFLDWRLVSFAWALPPEAKLGGGYTKVVLREAMKGMLPDDIRLRQRKIGFNSPVLQWFRGEVEPWLRAALDTSDTVGGLLDVEKLRKFHEERVRTGRLGWGQALRFWTCVNALRLSRLVAERHGVVA